MEVSHENSDHPGPGAICNCSSDPTYRYLTGRKRLGKSERLAAFSAKQFASATDYGTGLSRYRLSIALSPPKAGRIRAGNN